MTIPPLREDLVALEGYHSAQVDASVRLNTNESPYGPPREYLDELNARIARLALNRYPDRRARKLRAAVAESEHVREENVFCANGSNEVLQCLLLAFGGPGRRVLVFEPTYALHSHIARVTGTEVVAKARGAGFELTEAEVADAVKEVDPVVTFLCSPNNPTGLLEPRAAIRAALAAGSGLVVVDEAYGQFAPESVTSLFGESDSERLVVVRTFSKTWGLAGVRLGYALGDPRVIEACFSVVLPYHLSSLTQVAGEAVLEFGPIMDAHLATVVQERDRMLGAMASLRVETWPSFANFILFRPTDRSASEVWQGMLERSVLIRDCSTWRSLEGCLRVTIGTPEENDRFLAALKECG
jgi:histidinol-phosphate aminotransferase